MYKNFYDVYNESKIAEDVGNLPTIYCDMDMVLCDFISGTEEVLGVYGDACEKLTENIEKKLGVVQFTESTSDRYRNVVEQDHVSVSTQEDHYLFPGL